MTLRPWHWLLLVLALVVPLRAVALDGGGGSGLSASASLGVCGVAETGITCRIDVSWSGVEGAERYTAAATLADGSVRDLGTVGIGSGGGSTSVWVPYVGDGTYSVTITAWGSDEGKEKKLDRGKAKIDADKPADTPDKADKQDKQQGDGGKKTVDDPPNEQADDPPADPKPAPDPEPKPDPEPEPAPTPDPKPTPTPTPEPDPEPDQTPSPAPAPDGGAGSSDSAGTTSAAPAV